MNAADARPAPERQQHPAPHRDRVSRATTWFALLGGAIAWSLQELFNVGLAGYSCYPHDVPLAEPLWSGLRATTLGIDAFAIAICIASGVIAYANWRHSRDEKPGSANQLVGSGDGRTRFMAMAGMMVSALFLLANIVALFYIVSGPPCGG